MAGDEPARADPASRRGPRGYGARGGAGGRPPAHPRVRGAPHRQLQRGVEQRPCAQLINPAVPGYNFEAVSGVDYELDLTRPVGSRVTLLRYAGRAVAAGDSFSIALNNYRASGSGGYSMLLGAPVVYDRGESIRD